MRRIQFAIIVAVFVALIILRHVVGAFGFSLGYLYVGVISLSGFWFGFRGGIVAAAAAAAIFLIELFVFRDLVARDIAMNGIILRLIGYALAGTVFGYLSRTARRRTAKIEQLSEQKSLFVGMAAHDLRNPLSSIALISYSLLHDIDTKPTPKEKIKLTLENIHHASERMLALINDLLDVTKIETGHLDLHVGTCSYRDLVNRNVDYNRIVAERVGIKLVVRAEEELPDLEIDAIKIDQVLNNLVGNAIKFSPSGAVVTVTVSVAHGEVVTSVVDQGPGVVSDDLTRIFVAFYRAAPVTDGTAKQTSTGLGLAIAKRIVEAHGGRIWAENLPHAGSMFTFTLPVKLDRPPT